LDIGTNPNAAQHLAAFSRTRNDANVALMVEGIVCDDFQELNEAGRASNQMGTYLFLNRPVSIVLSSLASVLLLFTSDFHFGCVARCGAGGEL